MIALVGVAAFALGAANADGGGVRPQHVASFDTTHSLVETWGRVEERALLMKSHDRLIRVIEIISSLVHFLHIQVYSIQSIIQRTRLSHLLLLWQRRRLIHILLLFGHSRLYHPLNDFLLRLFLQLLQHFLLLRLHLLRQLLRFLF